MTETLMRTLTVTTAVGAGIAAGVFFAFSTFVMGGLGRAPAPVGVRAMQEINKQAVTPAFMLLLFGTGALCLLLAVVTLVRGGPHTALVVTAAVCYLGCLVLTAAYHVPLNDRLAGLDPDAAATAAQWRDYLTGWVRLNHVRTLSTAVACVLLVLAGRAS